MATRTLASPAHLFRWLVAPAAIGVFGIGALLTASITAVRRLVRPTLPRMSNDWMHALDRETSRDIDSWR
jgi:hypothetical protein